MSKKARMLLITTATLFGETIEFLLRQADVVETITTHSFEDFEQTADKKLLEIAPDIVLLATDEATYHTGRQIISKILETNPQICVIHTDRSQNTFYVHSTRALPARVNNLLEAIQNLT